MLSHKLTSGHYHTDPRKHLTYCQEPTSCLRQAKDVCQALLDDKFTPDPARVCPVCMEVLGGADDDAEDDLSAAALRRSVVVGACGHMLCGHCADNIQRVAAENFASGDNPYGSSVPINAACCPICRDPWAARPPLLHSTTPRTQYLNRRGVVYQMRCSRDVADYGDSPLVDGLRRLVIGLRRSEETCGVKKIAVVSHSSELTRFLHARASSVWSVPCVKLEGNMSAPGRGRSLRQFEEKAPPVMFATAAMLRGVVFEGLCDLIVTECLSLQERRDVMNLLRSSNNGEMRVHTLYTPVLVPSVPSVPSEADGGARSVSFVGKPGVGLPVVEHSMFRFAVWQGHDRVCVSV